MLKVLFSISLGFMLCAHSAQAAQYISRELSAPKTGSEQSQTSISELEKGVGQLKDAYARASTERFLARFYLQQGKDADLKKAIQYYQRALVDQPGEEGLSRFAKQETVMELADIYFYQKDYSLFIAALAQFTVFGGQLNQNQQLKQAVAFYHQGKKQQALATAKTIYGALKASKSQADKSLLQQLLFLFFHLHAYQRAADVQQQLLVLASDDIEQWRRLSQIYIKAQKNDRAAETLLLAHKKGLSLSEQDRILLCDLLALSKNPYAAAEYLSQFMQQGLLPVTVKRYQKLFNFWFQARETDKAIAALIKAAELEPEVERFLNIAELYRQQGQWQAMQDAVLKACAKDLADEFVSRANVFLGISELKMGHKASARQAFINATLVGGRGDVANQYLDFMQAPAPTEKELNSFYGPCKPTWASDDDRHLSLAGVAGFAVQQGDTARSDASASALTLPAFTVKTLASQRFILGQFYIAVDELENRLKPLAMKLGAYTVKNGGKINGPLHFIFPEPIPAGAKKIHFQMAFPISKTPMIKGRYKLLDEPEYYCASLMYQGSPEGLIDAWKDFYSAVIAKGLTPTGSSRQIALAVKSSHRKKIHLELQMQLHPPQN